jgi:fructose transport system permease protein
VTASRRLRPQVGPRIAARVPEGFDTRPYERFTVEPLAPTIGAVIGGISLFGGRGSILGTLFGALIVGVMSMGLNMMGADPQWKVLLTGVLIIAAVAVDQWIRQVSG